MLSARTVERVISVSEQSLETPICSRLPRLWRQCEGCGTVVADLGWSGIKRVRHHQRESAGEFPKEIVAALPRRFISHPRTSHSEETTWQRSWTARPSRSSSYGRGSSKRHGQNHGQWSKSGLQAAKTQRDVGPAGEVLVSGEARVASRGIEREGLDPRSRRGPKMIYARTQEDGKHTGPNLPRCTRAPALARHCIEAYPRPTRRNRD